MAAIAVAASLLGAFRLWQRAEHFRRQSALCALWEEQSTWYANAFANDPRLSTEVREDSVRGNLLEARQFGALKVIYARLASHPWEFLPPETPASVNPWDYDSLSTSELEEEMKARLDEKAAGERVHR
jgi:hypothetical protein